MPGRSRAAGVPGDFRYAAAALDDLDDIYLTIASDAGPERALRFVGRIQAVCERIAAFPRSGAPRNDLAQGLRTISVAGRVLIGYFVDDDGVLIARVLYGGRDLDDVFGG